MNQIPASPFGSMPTPEPLEPIEAVEESTGPARKLSPLHLAAAGGALLLVVGGGLSWALLRGGDDPDPGVAAPRPPASASASPSASTIGPYAPVVLATRAPFRGKGADSGSGGSPTTSAPAPTTATVTHTATRTTTHTATRTATHTTTVRATTTVTATPTVLYVHFVAWTDPVRPSLIVNDTAAATYDPGEELGGIGYVEPDPDDASNCAMVKVAGAADSTAVSVCLGETVKVAP